MTAYGAVCACGWRVGPVGRAGNPRMARWVEWYVDARRWLHQRRCGL